MISALQKSLFPLTPSLNSPTEMPTLAHHQAVSSYLEAQHKPNEMLQDIVRHVWLDEHGTVGHLRHSPLPARPDFEAHLQRLTPALRQQYLNLQLKDFLLAFYFGQRNWNSPTGEDRSSPDSGNSDSGSADPGNTDPDSDGTVANRFYKGLDIQFYEQLIDHNTGTGYFDPNWQVLAEEPERVWLQKDRLTVVAERSLHLQPADCSACRGDRVALRLPSNRINADRCQMIGNAGPPLAPAGPTLQVFLNLQPEGAADWVGQTTTVLNQQNIRFRLDLFHSAAFYEDRCDGSLLFVPLAEWEKLHPLLMDWCADLPLRAETLPLTAALSPGLSIAELPLSGSALFSAETFARHRCGAIAQALAQHPQAALAHSTTTSIEEAVQQRWTALKAAFARFSISWEHPYLNQVS